MTLSVFVILTLRFWNDVSVVIGGRNVVWSATTQYTPILLMLLPHVYKDAKKTVPHIGEVAQAVMSISIL
jgi:hypothetical protein